MRQRLASLVVTDILGLGVGVLISCGCHIKLLQRRKLKMMEIYSQRFGGHKYDEKCQQGHSRGKILPFLCQPLEDEASRGFSVAKEA